MNQSVREGSVVTQQGSVCQDTVDTHCVWTRQATRQLAVQAAASLAWPTASPHYVDSDRESLVFWLSLGSAGYVGFTRINWIWAGVPGRGRGGGRALLARGGEGWGGPLPARHAHYRVTCPPREGGTWVVLVTSTQLVPMKISSCRSSFE